MNEFSQPSEGRNFCVIVGHQQFYVNREFFASWSPVFADAALCLESGSSEMTLDLPLLLPADFSNLLSFLYARKRTGSLLQILKAANLLGIVFVNQAAMCLVACHNRVLFMRPLTVEKEEGTNLVLSAFANADEFSELYPLAFDACFGDLLASVVKMVLQIPRHRHLVAHKPALAERFLALLADLKGTTGERTPEGVGSQFKNRFFATLNGPNIDIRGASTDIKICLKDGSAYVTRESLISASLVLEAMLAGPFREGVGGAGKIQWPDEQLAKGTHTFLRMLQPSFFGALWRCAAFLSPGGYFVRHWAHFYEINTLKGCQYILTLADKYQVDLMVELVENMFLHYKMVFPLLKSVEILTAFSRHDTAKVLIESADSANLVLLARQKGLVEALNRPNLNALVAQLAEKAFEAESSSEPEGEMLT